MLKIFDNSSDPDMPEVQTQPTVQQPEIRQLVQQELNNQRILADLEVRKRTVADLEEKVTNGDLNNGAGYITGEGKYDMFTHNRDRQILAKAKSDIAVLEGKVMTTQEAATIPASPQVDPKFIARIQRIGLQVSSENAEDELPTLLPKVRARYQAGVNQVNWLNFTNLSDEGLKQMLDATWVHASGEVSRSERRNQSGRVVRSQQPTDGASVDLFEGKSDSQLMFLKAGGEPRLRNWNPGQAIPPLESRG